MSDTITTTNKTKTKKLTIEAYGIKGMKNLSWQKKFRDSEALCAWVEKNNAEVIGTRDIPENEQGR